MRQLVIPAAGYSSRFGSPKLLAEIRGERLIDRTLRMSQGLFDQTLVLVSKDVGLPNQVLVNPGTGSAGALREVSGMLADDVTVMWSDIVLLDQSLPEILCQPLLDGLAPYVPEVRPYCHLQLDGSSVSGVDYGKPLIGNHDQGIFRFRGEALKMVLSYENPNLLESFAWLHQMGRPVQAYRTSFPTVGFNEPAKLEWIRGLL